MLGDDNAQVFDTRARATLKVDQSRSIEASQLPEQGVAECPKLIPPRDQQQHHRSLCGRVPGQCRCPLSTNSLEPAHRGAAASSTRFALTRPAKSSSCSTVSRASRAPLNFRPSLPPLEAPLTAHLRLSEAEADAIANTTVI